MSTAELRSIGLRQGERVRFKRQHRSRWTLGHIASVGADGSILVHDANGAARSLRPEALEVERPNRRGRLTWRAVDEVATTWEQLDLFGTDS